MENKVLCMALITLVAAFSTTCFARGMGSAHAGGVAGSHISSEGLKNTNGPASADQDKGLARAEDRENAHGLAHERATDNIGKQKKHKKISSKQVSAPATK